MEIPGKTRFRNGKGRKNIVSWEKAGVKWQTSSREQESHLYLIFSGKTISAGKSEKGVHAKSVANLGKIVDFGQER